MITKALVLLTFNEITGSKALFDKIPFNLFDQVILVDGGSSDGTIEFWQDQGIEVVNQRSPGRGTAFIIAQNRCEEDILLFFSPDGNEDPSDIPRLLDMAEKGGEDIVPLTEDTEMVLDLNNKIIELEAQVKKYKSRSDDALILAEKTIGELKKRRK